jgi:hypothetical protein
VAIELKLFEASPAWAFVDDALVGFDLSFTKGLRVTGLDTVANTDAELEQISGHLFSLLCRIPDGFTVRFYSAELHSCRDELERFRRQFPETSLAARIAAEKVRQFEGDSNKRELIVILSTPAAFSFNHLNPGLLGKRASRMCHKAASLHADGVGQISRAIQTLQHGLASAGVKSRLLSTEELFETTWALSNPSICQHRSAPSLRSDVTARTQLFASGLLNASNFWVRDARYHRVITLRMSPRSVVPTQMLPLQSLPFPYVLVTTLIKIPDATALERVEKNRRQGHELNAMLAKLRGAERHAQMPDHALEQRRTEAEVVLAKIHNGDKLFDVAVQIWISASNKEALDEDTELVLAAHRGCNGGASRPVCVSQHAPRASLPDG